MILVLVQLVVIAACVGFLFREGMWGNFIRTVNVMFAGILATNFFEPLARLLEDMIGPNLTYFYDFLGFWLLYAIFFIVLHLATSAASRVKVRFNHYVDRTFSVIFSLSIGLTLVSMILFSLHLAPLGTKPFGTSVIRDDGIPLGVRWGTIIQGFSVGALSRSIGPEEEAIYKGPVASFGGARNIFEVYLKRAESLESQVNGGGGFTTESAPPR
ncbi:MAG: CvpA family protein [Thermogutta sp.]